MKASLRTTAVVLGLPYAAQAFAPGVGSILVGRPRSTTTMNMKSFRQDTPVGEIRSKLASLALVFALSTSVALVAPAAPAFAEALPEGTNPFTSICMGFGCGGFRGLEYPGAPAPTDEDSITFASFLDSLDKNMIAKVEFQSGGNKAYVWVKQGDEGSSEGSRIRIGEGYPDEQANGWSSPLWVVRALNDRKVPYKFVYDFGTQTESKVVQK